MSLVLSLVTSLLSGFISWLSNKLGKKMTRYIVLSVVFLISGVISYLKVSGLLTPEMIKELAKIFFGAVGIYEVVYKRILKDIIKK